MKVYVQLPPDVLQDVSQVTCDFAPRRLHIQAIVCKRCESKGLNIDVRKRPVLEAGRSPQRLAHNPQRSSHAELYVNEGWVHVPRLDSVHACVALPRLFTCVKWSRYTVTSCPALKFSIFLNTDVVFWTNATTSSGTPEARDFFFPNQCGESEGQFAL